MMRVPDAPGIGVELDEEKVTYYHECFRKLKEGAISNERHDVTRHLSRCQF